MELPSSSLKLLQLIPAYTRTNDPNDIIKEIKIMSLIDLEYFTRDCDNRYTLYGSGNTFLHYFVARESYPIVEALLERKVSINKKSIERYHEVYPLELALNNQDYQMIRLLILNGADPNLCDTYSIFYLSFFREMEKIILEFNFNTDKRYHKGRTSFHKAVYASGSPKIIEHYLETSDDIETDDTYGETPLDLVTRNIWEGSPEFVLPILKKKLFNFQNRE